MPLMRRFSLFFMLCWLPLFAHGQWFSSSSDSDFLPVMEAFQPSAWHDGETLSVGFDIADAYYLYRHQLSVTSEQPSIELGTPTLPQGIFTTDEFMGDVYVFREKVVFDIPLSQPYSGPIDIALTFQGCADAGLCYPPEQITLTAAEASPPQRICPLAKRENIKRINVGCFRRIRIKRLSLTSGRKHWLRCAAK